jgi:tRNA threonylcarbamoyladenosine biosynthesis protein TsaE
MTFVIETRSAHETKSWGRRLASVLEGGELLGLMGDLGAGKTCFIRGLASGLNLREGDILSPTFTMIQEHHGRMALYHIDLYRLEEAGLDDLGLREYLFTSGVAEELEVLSVRISYVSPSARRIEFVAASDRYAQLLERLRSRFA